MENPNYYRSGTSGDSAVRLISGMPKQSITQSRWAFVATSTRNIWSTLTGVGQSSKGSGISLNLKVTEC